MLLTKFQDNCQSGFEEEDFLRFWAFYSMTVILVNDLDHLTINTFSILFWLHMKYIFI